MNKYLTKIALNKFETHLKHNYPKPTGSSVFDEVLAQKRYDVRYPSSYRSNETLHRSRRHGLFSNTGDELKHGISDIKYRKSMGNLLNHISTNSSEWQRLTSAFAGLGKKFKR